MVRVKKQDVMISNRIPSAMNQKLQAFTIENQKAQSEVVRWALRNFLKDIKLQQAFLDDCENGRHC